jgi:hypothetical protein
VLEVYILLPFLQFVLFDFETVQQYFSYIVAVSFIDGGNRITGRKPPTCCRNSLTNIITYCCVECTSSSSGFEITIHYVVYFINVHVFSLCCLYVLHGLIGGVMVSIVRLMIIKFIAP